MKILYESIITKDTGFSADEFPDRFEILRPGKTPLVFKPVAIDLQAIYARLQEAEELLKRVDKTYQHWKFNVDLEIISRGTPNENTNTLSK